MAGLHVPAEGGGTGGESGGPASQDEASATGRVHDKDHCKGREEEGLRRGTECTCPATQTTDLGGWEDGGGGSGFTFLDFADAVLSNLKTQSKVDSERQRTCTHVRSGAAGGRAVMEAHPAFLSRLRTISVHQKYSEILWLHIFMQKLSVDQRADLACVYVDLLAARS